MRTRLGLFCDKVIEAGWLAALIVVPLFFNIYSQRVFEPDKLTLLRSIALVMSVAWVLRTFEDWRTGEAEQVNGRGPAIPARSASRPGLAGALIALVAGILVSIGVDLLAGLITSVAVAVMFGALLIVYRESHDLRSFWKWLAAAPLALPTLLLVLVYLVSTVLSVTSKVAFWGSYQRLQGMYTTLSYIVVFFLMIQGLRTKRQFGRVVTVMVLASFPIALYGLVQHFALDTLPWGGNVTFRVASNMGNAIFVAAYLIMIIPLTLARLLENWKETVGTVRPRDAVLGALAFVLLVGALLAGMLLRTGEGTAWLRWVALLVGLGLQAPIYLLTPPERRATVLAISLPLSFTFLVGFSWTLEILFPPASSNYFWLGLMAMFIFAVAMAAFAYYLRKPLARLLLLAAYFSILVTQVVCIFYTQSRGPLLGLLAGVFFFLALFGLIRRQVWLPWVATAFALVAVVFLVIFNTVQSPLFDALRETSYVGRLGKILQTESGTGKVRILIWEGVIDMISPHPPLEYPGNPPAVDGLNAIRPFIGYGPESMYVAYNRFYQPDLAHYEKRNASPDRSHNETFDALATTGLVGFLVYMFLFTSVFLLGLRQLGLVQKRWHQFVFLALWIGGGVAGGLATWAWRGPLYLGVGIPGGIMAGLAVYVFVFIVLATVDRETCEKLGGRYSLWTLALLSAVVAHFVEIHFGIAIASTRTNFWAIAALLVVIGLRLAAPPAVEDAAPAEETKSASRRRRRRPGAAAPVAQTYLPISTGRDWQGSIVVLSLVAIVILGTMLFDVVTIQDGYPGPFQTLWKSLTQGEGSPPMPVMLYLLLVTWVMIGLIGLGDLATREESEGKQPVDWLRAIGIFALITFSGVLTFGLLHAARLQPVTIDRPGGPNPIASTITFYYLAFFVLLLALAAVLAFWFGRTVRPSPSKSGVGAFGLVALAVLLPLLAGILIYITNTSIIRADIIYKQGLSSERARQWDAAIYFYQEAIDIARNEDFYYLFLGRAMMEKGRASQGQELDRWLAASEEALAKAREIAPLNTDHSANLARLFRTWGGLSTGEQRVERLAQALIYYEDALSLSPNNAQLFNEWGQTYSVLGDFEQAKAKYQKSLALDNKYEQTHLLLGELAMEQENYDEAVRYYQGAVGVNPRSALAYSSLGYVYTKMGNQEAALAAYEQAAALSPTNYNNRKNLAILYMQVGRIQDAILEATEALKLAPDDERAQMEAFLAQLQQQGAASPAEDQAQAAELVKLGQAQMEAQQWISAAATLSEAVRLDPTSVQAHSALAYVYAKQGRTREAIAENLFVASIAPDDYNSRKNLALLYQQEGELEEALAQAEQALPLAPDNEQAALESLIAQLAQATDDAPAAHRAGDLTLEERVDMYRAAPAMTIDPNKTYRATIVTTKGNIIVDLHAKEAPQTVNNFVFLAREGFYEGVIFHRVENQPGFVLIQGGDPTGTGTGGPGYTVPAEIGLPHDEGAIAMARTGDQVNPKRASSGSQFYICLVPIHQLDGAYTVFGYVVEGLDVAKQIAVGDKILSVEVVENGLP